ncbi:hypothetical protein CK203_029660 [Vitis vinifera]|uniref:Uncharacterized protein n=1 Tax=Vitis vinifera TaxID=29760 RepID=A0A438II88_VITVI|nr:hypothetical protein CK203_029660 [Vitis vinifera]
MSANKKAVTSVRAGDVHEKPIDKLSVKEFRDRFCIPNGVTVEFLDEEEVVSTEKAKGRAITFSKKQFNAGAPVPSSGIVQGISSFSQIPPAFIHPNIVRVLMGCNIINMLFNLDLSLLELPDSTKGGAKGYVVVRGVWAGLLGHPERPFSPNYSMVLPGPDRRGHIVDWVEKTSFACLNKLFEIDAGERHYETLLTDAEPDGRCSGVPRVYHQYSPRKLPKKVVPGEHYILKDLYFYKEEPINPPPHSISSGPGHVAGLNHSGSSLLGAELPLTATPLEEMGAESQSLPSGEPSLVALVLVKGPASKRSRSARNLKFGLIGRLQDRFQDIEVSCSSAQDAHPEGSEVEMTTETPTVSVVVRDEGAPGETHPAENVEAPDPEEELLSNASLGGILLMMRLAPSLALLATRSWKRS